MPLSAILCRLSEQHFARAIKENTVPHERKSGDLLRFDVPAESQKLTRFWPTFEPCAFRCLQGDKYCPEAHPLADRAGNRGRDDTRHKQGSKHYISSAYGIDPMAEHISHCYSDLERSSARSIR